MDDSWYFDEKKTEKLTFFMLLPKYYLFLVIIPYNKGDSFLTRKCFFVLKDHLRFRLIKSHFFSSRSDWYSMSIFLEIISEVALRRLTKI